MEENENQISFEERSAEKGYVVLSIIGDLVMWSLPAAKQKVEELLEQGKKKIVFDLEKTNYIDSAGLGFFIGTLKNLKGIKGDMILINLNTYIYGIFQLIQLHNIIDIYDNLEEATKHFDKKKYYLF
jgi:anti-sigma B factor antagonist